FPPSNSPRGACRGDVLAVSIWDLSTTSVPHHLHGLDGTANGLTFDRTGTRLATAGPDGIVKVWNIAAGTMSHLFHAQSGWAAGVAFSPDGARLASSGRA